MKNNIKFIFILFFLSIPSLILSLEINFFVNYNLVTFSSFDNFINSKFTNFNIYLEYNPLIITYLNWNKKYLIRNLKNEINNGRIKLFKIKDSLTLTAPAKKWFRNIQKDTDKQIFSTIKPDQDILSLNKVDIDINILNLKELKSILQTMSNNKIKKKMNFKIDLSLFLYEKIDRFLSIIQQYKDFKINLFICSDTRYSASEKEINDFVDLIYSIKSEKKLNNYEMKIFNLSYILFSIKLFNRIDDLMLNLFPLTTNLIKKYNVSSIEYQIKENKYITLFDKENFFTFDTKNGYLKKWFLYNKGVSLINFNSFMETVYIKGKNDFAPVTMIDINYSKFNNGLSFNYNFTKSIKVEKNMILQYKKIFLTYKIRNNYKRTRKIIFVIENKYSPSLLDCMVNLKNDFAFYTYKKGFTTKYNSYIHSFVNLNTGYGISWEYFNKPDGIEFFKDFYNFTKRIYFKFTLYPFEQKVITISYRKTYIKQKDRASFIKKEVSLTNQYFGNYGVHK